LAACTQAFWVLVLFSKPELNQANLCATALWYGINFQTGDSYHVGDASLMSNFAFNFYHKNKKKFTPDIFVAYVYMN